MGVRPMESSDLPKLAGIHVRSHGDTGNTFDEIDRGYRTKLPELVLSGPYAEHASPSLVFELDGEVVGFVLVGCRPMLFRGERVWMGMTTHLAVLPEARSSLAGLHLVKTALAGPQDFTYVDRSNSAGRQAAKAAGSELFPAYSIYWRKVLRPTFGLSARLARRMPRGGELVRSAARQIETHGPSAIRRRSIVELPDLPRTLATEPLSVDRMMAAAPAMLARYDLHPDFTDRDIIEHQWNLLERARPNNTTIARAVVNTKGKTLGWYVVTIDPDCEAEVLQLISAPNQRRVVLLALLHDMQDSEVVSVTGAMRLSMLYDIESFGCVMLSAGFTTSVRTDNAELMGAFRNETALVTSLDGEFLINPPAAVAR